MAGARAQAQQSPRDDVRARLIAAAEELFERSGLDSVSLREVTIAAGATNASAINYYFGDRAGLVRAVLEKHHAAVEARRHALLDEYEDAGRDDLRALSAALVKPFAAELSVPGGAGYMQVEADVINRPLPILAEDALSNPKESVTRWRVLVGGLIDAEAAKLHRRFFAVQFTLTALARRAHSANPARGDDRVYVNHLIDMVTAMLAAPVSDETQRARARRRR
jgi:AcrR family transcriptional regulator